MYHQHNGGRRPRGGMSSSRGRGGPFKAQNNHIANNNRKPGMPNQNRFAPQRNSNDQQSMNAPPPSSYVKCNTSNNGHQAESTPQRPQATQPPQTVTPNTNADPKQTSTPVAPAKTGVQSAPATPAANQPISTPIKKTENTPQQTRTTPVNTPNQRQSQKPAQPAEDDGENATNTKLFIATVKQGISDEEFRELFTKFGTVTNSFLHKTKWFGLVTFETHEQADAARKHYSNSNILKLKWAQDTNKETPLILNQEQSTAKKESSSKCRLFIGNLSPGVTEDQIRKLVEPFGSIVELFVRPNKSFSFVRYETRANAEAAKAALDGSSFCGKQIEVRFASQGAVLKVRNLSPFVSNELLSQAFEPFGELERATVFADERGKSLGEGILEFSKKPVALSVLRKAQQDCLLLTNSPLPVIIEPMEIRDDEDGYSEKMINKQSHAYLKEREKAPRFAEKGSFEYDFSMKWKELLSLEKAKKRQLDTEFQTSKDKLLEEMELMRYDYDLDTLKRKLSLLEGQKQEMDNRRMQAERKNREREEEMKTARKNIAMRQAEILGYTFVDDSPQQAAGSSGPGFQNAGNGAGYNGPQRGQNFQNAAAQNPNQHLFSGHPVADAVIEAALLPTGDPFGKPSAAAEDFLKNWTSYTQGAPPPPPPPEKAGDDKKGEGGQRPQNQKFNNQNKPTYVSYIGQGPPNRKRPSDHNQAMNMNNNMNHDKRKRI